MAAIASEVAKLPISDAITVVKGKGERHLVVFADPNCGYCQKLEPEIQKLQNVTVHTFLYPILGPDSIDKSRRIWCAKEKGEVWERWMTAGSAIPERDPKCTAVAVDRNVAVGRSLGVTGTPAMYFVDGAKIGGAADAGAIESQLKASAKASSKS